MCGCVFDGGEDWLGKALVDVAVGGHGGWSNVGGEVVGYLVEEAPVVRSRERRCSCGLQ
jgi:hypothetical protein